MKCVYFTSAQTFSRNQEISILYHSLRHHCLRKYALTKYFAAPITNHHEISHKDTTILLPSIMAATFTDSLLQRNCLQCVEKTLGQ